RSERLAYNRTEGQRSGISIRSVTKYSFRFYARRGAGFLLRTRGSRSGANRRQAGGSSFMSFRLLSAIRIATGLLFFQHGAEQLWGFAGGQIDHNFLTLHGFAGPLEVIGGALITFGLLTRLTAFILC